MSDATMTRSGPTVRRGKSKQDYGTPRDFIRAVERRFGRITFDLAASASNTVVPLSAEHGYRISNKCWFDKDDDSLVQNWAGLYDNAWLNPEFDNIALWAEKMAREMRWRRALTFFLTPASIGTDWFAKHVAGKAMVLGLSPRLTFEGCDDPYPKDLMLSVYGFGFHGFDTWRWTTKDHSE
jgi:hypothetical protein